MQKLKNLIRMPTMHSFVHHAHNLAHCTYLGAVFHEAHGLYGQAAGVLLLLVILSMFLHEPV